MHIYNQWLPAELAAEAAELEPKRFNLLAQAVAETWQHKGGPATLQWISAVDSFVSSKTELGLDDVELVVSTGLDIVLASPQNLFLQVRWAVLVSRLLRKFRHQLRISIPWQPLHQLLMTTHFGGKPAVQGAVIHQIHVSAVKHLIKSCRRFFPAGSAAQIWAESRPGFEDLAHNDALLAAGLLSLFLPTLPPRELMGGHPSSSKWSQWVPEWMALWRQVPNCPFWDQQWAFLIGRCAKHLPAGSVSWEPLLPQLFTHYLSFLEVPVGGSLGGSTTRRAAPRECARAFPTSPLPKAAAKGIVMLLGARDASSALARLEAMAHFLEQFLHPSNGGHWTSKLEKLMRFLAFYFLKRLAYEQQGVWTEAGGWRSPLQAEERAAVVDVLLMFLQRAQFSKNSSVAATSASTAAALAQLEPLRVLPVVLRSFQLAMDTVTATHQLEAAVTCLALCTRSLLLTSRDTPRGAPWEDGAAEPVPGPKAEENRQLLAAAREAIAAAMFAALPGIDANDPPKTLGVLHLFFAVLCSCGQLGDEADGGSGVLPIDWSLWVDEFLSRLLALLGHLEQSYDDSPPPPFLLQEKGGSVYRPLLELLMARLTPPLFQQAMKKVSAFAMSSVLPGAGSEIGTLLAAIAYAHPEAAMDTLLEPLAGKVLALLEGTQRMELCHLAPSTEFRQQKIATLSAALEASVEHVLSQLASLVGFGGAAILPHKALLLRVLAAALDTPAGKVRDQASRLLSLMLAGVLFLYPTDEYRVATSPGLDLGGIEPWVSTKGESVPHLGATPAWHSASPGEVDFAQELLELHLRGGLKDLHTLCELPPPEGPAAIGRNRDAFHLAFQRVGSCLQGLKSCLPDFDPPPLPEGMEPGAVLGPLCLVGASGAAVGGPELREEVTAGIYEAFLYVTKMRSDDTLSLIALVSIMDRLANHGAGEYRDWMEGKGAWQSNANMCTETRATCLYKSDAVGRRRPQWLLVERAYGHLQWRASQSSYRHLYPGARQMPPPPAVRLLLDNLLQLSLSKYRAVRETALHALERVVKRYPMLGDSCLPKLAAALAPGATDEDAAAGACAVYACRPIMRRLTQDWAAMSSFMSSLLGSSHHGTPEVQAAIGEVFLSFCMRFLGLPNPRDGAQAPPHVPLPELMGQLQAMAKATGQVHWRYTLMANAFLLLLVRSSPEGGQGQLSLPHLNPLEHFGSGLGSDLPPLRPLSVVALLLLLSKPLASTQEGIAKGQILGPLSSRQASDFPSQVDVGIDVASLAEVLTGGTFMEAMLQSLATDHHLEGTSNASRGANVGASMAAMLSRLGADGSPPIVRGLAATAVAREWPVTKGAAGAGLAFSPLNAALFQHLADALDAPGGGAARLVAALRAPLAAAVAEVGERGLQCTAAEVFAGLLRSNAPAVIVAWADWLGSLFRQALQQASLESTQDWAAAVRFATTGSMPGGGNSLGPALRSEVIMAVAEQPPGSAVSGQLVKRLTHLVAASREIQVGPQGSAQVAFQSELLAELRGSLAHPSMQVQESVGRLLATLCASCQRIARPGDDVPAWESFRAAVLSFLDALPAQAQVAAAQIQTSTLNGTIGSRILSRAVAFEDGTATPMETDGGPEAVHLMETVLHLAIEAMSSGDAVLYSGTLAALLPSILAVQESADDDLSSLAKLALANFKLLLFPARDLPVIVDASLGAGQAANWHTRVATLRFLQAFVFRHTFLLEERHLASLRGLVMSLLSDPQLEVREVASATLAGLLKGADEAWATEVRHVCAASARSSLRSAKRGRSKKASQSEKASGASMAVRHGHILGMAACVLSAPYDVPEWMPDALMVLAESAHEPPPIRTTVSKTIGDFRRTHADTWTLHKEEFTEDQLEVLLGLTSTSSYFV